MTATEETDLGTVLIVEDEQELAEILEYSLNKEGLQTVKASDGLAACRLVGEHHPDLILLDINLPVLDGWEVCRLIRGHEEKRIASIPIIMLTALNFGEARLKGLLLGADAYIGKPYSVREVVLQTRNLLRRRHQQRSLGETTGGHRRGSALAADIQMALLHELRNQMLIIRGFSELMTKKEAVIPAEKSRTYLEAISQSSAYLSALAEEFLMVRRLEDGQLELPCQRQDPAAVAREVAALLQPAAREKGIALLVDCRERTGLLLLNRTALMVALSSLLENAVKYSPQGSTVTLECSEPPDGGMHLTVHDEGPGVAAEERERIFERFYRGAATRDQTRGTGLGLYIARTLTRVMGGEISLANRPGKVSRFTLTLPAPIT